MAKCLKKEALVFVKNLYRRLSEIESCAFLCNKVTAVLTEHMKQMNCVSFDLETKENVRAFQVHVCLQNRTSEQHHLQLVRLSPCVCEGISKWESQETGGHLDGFVCF